MTFTMFHSSDTASPTEVGTIAETAVETPELESTYLSTEEYAEAFTEEVEVMAFVDELLTVSDPSQLDDAALAELLF